MIASLHGGKFHGADCPYFWKLDGKYVRMSIVRRSHALRKSRFYGGRHNLSFCIAQWSRKGQYCNVLIVTPFVVVGLWSFRERKTDLSALDVR